MDQQDEVYGRMILQRQGERMLVQNPPMRVLTTEELDHVYGLPYTCLLYTSHPAAPEQNHKI